MYIHIASTYSIITLFGEGGVLVDWNCPGCDVECVILCSLFFLFNTQNRERERIFLHGGTMMMRREKLSRFI